VRDIRGSNTGVGAPVAAIPMPRPRTSQPPTEDDAALFALEEQFNAIAAELLSLQQGHGERLVSCSDQQSSAHDPARPRVRARNDEDAMTRQAEALLARLHPIEQAIMAMPAHTIAGLGVKARHAAYVMSQYWSAPIDSIDWDAQAVRLLIEAVCDLARVPLPIACNDRASE
jgi:hypothetical protein